MQTYSLCQDCYFRYKAEGRAGRSASDAVRRKDGAFDEREKNAAFAKLLLAAPDLLGGAELSNDQG